MLVQSLSVPPPFENTDVQSDADASTQCDVGTYIETNQTISYSTCCLKQSGSLARQYLVSV